MYEYIEREKLRKITTGLVWVEDFGDLWRGEGVGEMYPLQPSYELENQIPCIPCIPSIVPCQPDQILNDLPMTRTTHHGICNLPLNSTYTHDMGQKQKHELRSSTEILENNNGKDDQGSTKQRRIMHRDIERQRRQEMANLYASLRSLLPLEYIKGKRAISDHMHEAVNYIKCLQKNIGQLRARRESLMKMSKLSSFNSGNIGDADTHFPICTKILVSPCRDGVEVLICSSPKEEVFPLSRVLKMLLAQGLNVVSCVSTTVNEVRVHKFLSEVTNDQTCIDLLALPQKLTNMIEQKSNSK